MEHIFRPLKSLHARIFLFAFLMGIVPFSILTPATLYIYRSIVINSDSQELMSSAQTFSYQIVTSKSMLSSGNDPGLVNQLEVVARSYHGRIMIVNSSLRVVFDSYDMDEGKIIVWEHVIRAAKGEKLSYFDKDTKYLLVTVPITNSDGDIVGVTIISKSMDYLQQTLDKVLSFTLLAMLVVYALCLTLALVFSNIFTKPMRNLSKGFENVVLEYDNLVPEIKSYRELEDITKNANAALIKLHDIDESRREFVSNVSHELKTPLTSMKVLADSLNGGGDVPIEMYKEFMQDIGEEIDRETKIVNDLLSLVRMDKKDAKLNISSVDMNEIIELVLKRLKPIATKSEIELEFESIRQVICEIDEVKIVQVITNLVENGIKYNNKGGYVKVTLDSDHQYCNIKVEDNGLGIPEEAIDHIFERFYRADKSHSRQIQGSGLGLAITKSAIVMHRGDIKVSSVLGEGTVFDVKLPLIYITNSNNQANVAEKEEA